MPIKAHTLHIVIVSHTDLMTAEDQESLKQLQQEYQAYNQVWLFSANGQIDIEQLKQDYIGSVRQIQPFVKTAAFPWRRCGCAVKIQQLPYHYYVESAQGYAVAGWKLPKRWQFDFYDLIDLLCEQQDWLRIKGILIPIRAGKALTLIRAV